MNYEFKAWPKIPRLSKMQCGITEKLDGTNAIIHITPLIGDSIPAFEAGAACVVHTDGHQGSLVVFAGSRSRWVQPQPKSDNFGFAKWVADNATKLVELLGEGTHYGEWWGQGIQRTYGLTKKYFTLFNPWRYGCGQNPAIPQAREQIERDTLLGVVPILSQEQFNPSVVGDVELQLTETGSVAVPGWMTPEGFVVSIANEKYKVVIHGDGNKKVGA